MLNPDDLTALWITLKLAAITTVILLIFGTPLAWWLANARTRLKPAIDALIALPLVLPPTVLGFYLLLALSPDGVIGKLSIMLGGSSLAFTFTGLVIGSVIYSLPFVVQPLQNTFNSIGQRPLEVAATLGAKPLD
ncbi:MAG: molybdate ABC transporter permease subunit, partial [Gammaproteobacteria bacterium]